VEGKVAVEKVETAAEKADGEKAAAEEEKEKAEQQEKNRKFAKEQEETVLNSGIYRLKQGVPVSATGNPIYSLGISADGSKLVVGGKDNVMRVWNTTTMIQTFQTSDGEAHAENMWTKSLLAPSTDKYLRKVAISPDGTKIASAHADHQLRMWVDGKVSWTKELPASCYALTFNPAGTQLAVGVLESMNNIMSGTASKVMHVLDATTGDDVWMAPAMKKPILAIAFSADGRYVVHNLGQRVFVLTTEGFHPFAMSQVEEDVKSLVFSPSKPSELVIGDEAGNIYVADLETVQDRKVTAECKHRNLGGHVQSMAFSADGARLVAGINGLIGDNKVNKFTIVVDWKAEGLSGFKDAKFLPKCTATYGIAFLPNNTLITAGIYFSAVFSPSPPPPPPPAHLHSSTDPSVLFVLTMPDPSSCKILQAAPKIRGSMIATSTCGSPPISHYR